MSPAADRNLLFGILALQLDFIRREQLITAMKVWTRNKDQSIGAILVGQGTLAADGRQLLDALVAEHLKKHNGDPGQSLAALSTVDPEIRAELAQFSDEQVRGSLIHLKTAVPDPTKTQVGAPPPTWSVSDSTARAATPGVRYRILRPHAKGGLGEVFVAEDTELGREVALKEIQERYADSTVSRTRFVVEAEITGGLEHPGVVPVYGLGTYADGRPYYAMRFIRGDNLRSAIRRFHDRTPLRYDDLEFRQLLRRFVDVCNAIAYAHARGVLHRDLKPGNIMLGQYGETLVVDWGLAKVTGKAGEKLPALTDPEITLQPRSGGESSATVAGQALGTPSYMSPEQAAGRLDELGPATDIYSLGATLFELLVGKNPFEGTSVADTLARVQRGEFGTPRTASPGVPPALEAICLRAMALKPGDRYPTALDLSADVERWLGDEPVSAYREPVIESVRRWLRKHRTASAIAAFLLLGCTAGGLLFGWQQDRARQAVIAEQKKTDEQRRKTLEAVNAMIAPELVEQLALQESLTAEQRAFLGNTVSFYRELAAGDDPAGKRTEADATLNLAYLRHVLGQFAEAKTAYAAAEPLFAALPDEPAVARRRAKCRVMLGQLRMSPEPKQAESDLQAGVDLLTKLSATDTVAQKDLADARTRLGQLFYNTSRHADANQQFSDAIAGLTRLRQADAKNGAITRQLADVYKSAATNQFRKPGATPADQAEARKNLLAAIALLEEIGADRAAPRHNRLALAQCRNQLGLVTRQLKQWPEMVAVYRQAAEGFDALARDYPLVPDYRNDLLSVCHNLGKDYDLKDQPHLPTAEREKFLDRAVSLGRSLVAENPENPVYQEQLALNLAELAKLHSGDTRLAQAKTGLAEAMAIQTRLVEKFRDHPKYEKRLAAFRQFAAELEVKK